MVTKITRSGNEEILEWWWAAEDELIPQPFYTSCYLIDGLLIDCGAPGGVNDFREFVVTQLGNQGIDKCIITHTHEDHIGGAHVLQEEHGIPLYASNEAIAILKNGFSYQPYRQLYWGSDLRTADAKPLPGKVSSESGKYTFHIVPTPGHAPDQVAFIEKQEQWAFVADAVLPKYKLLFGGTCNIQEDVSLIYYSILRLYEFTEGIDNLQVFVSGKGTFKGREYLKERILELENFRKTAHGLLNKGLDEQQILDEMFGGESVIGMFTDGELSRMNLVKSLLKWSPE
ncbi:MAG: MBL fold metallo-hydrolase [Candidatus Odinarchaeota archaeon]